MLGPVFRYEMVASARRVRNTVIRATAGLLLLVLLWVGYTFVPDPGRGGMSIEDAARVSNLFYLQFAWGTLLAVLAVTPSLAAGAIAQERERRTIEYLFTTHLTSREIVVDKIAARLCTVGAWVLATLPVLAIFRLLGGVSGEALLWHFALLASAATLAAAIALTVGAWCDRTRDATPRATGAVVVWLLLMPIALGLSRSLPDLFPRGWRWISDVFVEPVLDACVVGATWINPLVTLGALTDPRSGAGVGMLATSVAAQFALAAVLLAYCAWRVRAIHARAMGAAAKASKPWTTWRLRPGRRQPPYEERPMLWKEMHASPAKQRGWWIVRVLGRLAIVLAVASPVVTAFVSSILSGRGSEYLEVSGGIGAAVGSLLALVVGSRGAGLVTAERESQTWLTLVSTPLTAAQIVDAKVLGNLWAVRKLLVALLAVHLLGVVFEWRVVFVAVAYAVTLVTLTYAASAIGVGLSLRMKTSSGASGAASALLLGLGVGVSGLIVMLASVGGMPNEGVLLILAAPPCAPFLLMAPSLILNGNDERLVASLVLGVVGYLMIGLFARGTLIAAFDKRVGRTPDTAPDQSPQVPVVDKQPLADSQ